MFGIKTREQRIRALLIFFMVALGISGITAIPLQWEIGILNQLFGPVSSFGAVFPAFGYWIGFVHDGLLDTFTHYPFLAYGTDWLAFAHVVIAVAFIGPLRDPVKNIWVIEFGMIACALIIPWTLIFGALRDIPFFWRLVDMSFGVIGVLPLWFVRSEILKITVEG